MTTTATTPKTQTKETTTSSKAQKISPMLWFDNEGEEAVQFYTSAFPNSKTGRIARYGKEGYEIHGQKEGTAMTINFELDGYQITALNGGPFFKINPSISFYVTFEDEKQLEESWKKLSGTGTVMMPLNEYPWSKKYGWLQDKFGVSWQISLGNKKDVDGNTVVPFLMFVKGQHGKAEAAINFYTSVFKNSGITGIMRFGADESPEKEDTVKHAQFTLAGQTFMIMESALDHQFSFNEAISLVVSCENQSEIDYYWDKLSEGGDPKAQVCGWLKDKFGVSWQVVPKVLEQMLQSPEKEKRERVTKAYLKMKKFDIAELEKAFEGK